MSNLTGKYFVKNTSGDSWQDITTKFQGVRILSITGMNAKGEPKNVYTEDWMYNDAEDFEIVMPDSSDAKQIIRKNVDINVTFAVRQKYVTNGSTIDVRNVHDTFTAYMTDTDVYLKSGYEDGMYAHCVCLKGYEPTLIKLQRGSNSFALGTITLHCLNKMVEGGNGTYTLVHSPTGNPNSLGYYERDGENYRKTWDTTVLTGKSYYTKS